MRALSGGHVSLTRFARLCAGLALLSLPLAGCGSSNPPAQSPPGAAATAPAPASAPAPGEKRYHLMGTVVQIDKAQGHLVVDHGDIPGFMSAMTMPYPVADAATLDRVHVGDQVTADVVVTNDIKIRLENVVVVKKADAAKPSPASQALPGPGVPVPDFAMIDQDGKRIDLRQYAGKTVLMTFIYTRCPLPDYCPLATHNFAQIEKELTKTPGLYAKTQLLSVSFDSKYDTPAVLRNYARQFVPDKNAQTFKHWEFATVPASELPDVTKFFGIFLNQEDGQITHSMCTVVISPDGKLYQQDDDNDWKPEQMLAALTSAASITGTPKLRVVSAR